MPASPYSRRLARLLRHPTSGIEPEAFLRITRATADAVASIPVKNGRIIASFVSCGLICFSDTFVRRAPRVSKREYLRVVKLTEDAAAS